MLNYYRQCMTHTGRDLRFDLETLVLEHVTDSLRVNIWTTLRDSIERSDNSIRRPLFVRVYHVNQQ
jgi:hypothetical protein